MTQNEKDILFWLVEGLLAIGYPHQQPRDIRTEKGYGITILLGDDTEFKTNFDDLVDRLRTIGDQLKGDWWYGVVYSTAEFSNHKTYEVFESEAEAKDWLHGLNNPYTQPAREIFGPFTLKEILTKALNK